MVSEQVKEAVVVPQGVTVTISGATLKVKGKTGELARVFKSPDIKVAKEGDGLVVVAENPRRPAAVEHRDDCVQIEPRHALQPAQETRQAGTAAKASDLQRP